MRMDQTVVMLVIGLALGIGVGFLLGYVVTSRKRALDGDAVSLRAQLELVQSQYADLQSKQEVENKILQTLLPVSERLADMQRTVVELEKARNEQHGQITQQLRSALESEELLRGTTEQLASALRSNSTRGVWGEVQLRRVVEAAGLIERVDFDVQAQISSDAGVGKPDMVIHLPGGKNIAVDAKVPFNAYLEASQIPFTATGEEAARREALLKQHVAAVRSHVDALGKKSYWDGLDASPELVICFIPSEALISTAIEADPTLMDYAFSKKVALASPVTLWSVLISVAFSWEQDVLTEDAAKLLDVGREMLQRLGAMAKHVETLGRSISSTVRGYNAFVGSLESRVLVSARKLNDLGQSADLADELEGIDTMPRQLSAPELTENLETKELD